MLPGMLCQLAESFETSIAHDGHSRPAASSAQVEGCSWICRVPWQMLQQMPLGARERFTRAFGFFANATYHKVECSS